MKKTLLILTAIALIGCKKDQVEKKEEQEIKKPVVAIREITPKSIDERIYLSGDVMASNSVDIFPDVAGKVDRIDVQEGDYVRKDVQVATVDRNKPGMNFAPSPVLSPITGTITQVYAKKGALAAPSMPLFKIGTLDQLEIVTHVSEKDLNRVKLGQKATITTDSFPGEEFIAIVSELNPVVNPVTRTMQIKLNIVGDVILKPGMFVDLHIITNESKNTIVLNRDEVFKRNNKFYVWKYSYGVVSQVEITVGIENDNYLEIISGIELGDTIVSQGFTYLEDGIEVKTLKKEAK